MRVSNLPSVDSLLQHYHHKTCCSSPLAGTMNTQYSYSTAKRITG